MNTKYKDLIEQTFDFPQEEFHTENGNLRFHNINLAQLVEQYGTPLKFTYLPKIPKISIVQKNGLIRLLKSTITKGSTIIPIVQKVPTLSMF